MLYIKESFTQKRILCLKNLISELDTRIKFSFSHEHLKHQTALSKHFWSLKNKGLTTEIQWALLKKSNE